MYYKITFMLSLLSGTLLSISSYSWMGMWMGLEINLLSIIPLMSDTKNMMASEAALKYFITQALASSLLLFSMIILSMNFFYTLDMNLYLSLILNTSLLTKMGAAPFHFWFPEVMDGLNWPMSLVMLTWQKIAPMMLLTYFSLSSYYLTITIIFSMMISGIVGLNQTSLRKILAYSSINHIGWMLSAILIQENTWFLYFIVYSIITMNIVFFFKMFNIFHLKQLFNSMNHNFSIKFSFILNFLSLAGLPPLLGFLPKWLTIQALTENSMYAMAILIITMTLMTMYFYLRIIFSSLLLNSNELAFLYSPPLKSALILVFNFITVIGLIFSTVLFNFL
uniref:NADH-ubiquinone oxidoreductase chain 2 n=1 Tax=Polyphylla gracilicornis TaxID=1618307 RepID=A0A7S9H4N8_9SCAR|nr:NADH dehydrogenase subunit 2 [Polyphylla gracilicornis]QPF96295.1 NADH dehydrogenase subunit 2 [Polyphylla gracilicornis]